MPLHLRADLLADEASYARGVDYFRRGRVLRSTTKPDGTIDGVVEGEDFYRVRLGPRDWSCSCPMGANGVFCKHCVAVALAVDAADNA
ncbi:MAG TPA: SWIM zinc finger family protein, partial [Galbitalea sp.]|nr:SWIM zinc finger family protein [Galbitalea sp.]